MSDLDDLMSRLADLDAKEVGLWTNSDIDTVIAYQRRIRALKEQGVKVKKGKPDGPKKTISLLDLGLKAKPEEMKRRL